MISSPILGAKFFVECILGSTWYTNEEAQKLIQEAALEGEEVPDDPWHYVLPSHAAINTMRHFYARLAEKNAGKLILSTGGTGTSGETVTIGADSISRSHCGKIYHSSYNWRYGYQSANAESSN